MSDNKNSSNRTKTNQVRHCKHCLCYQKEDDTCMLKDIDNCSKKCEFAKCDDFKWNDRFTMF
jgi:hypothetical protein